MRAAVLVLVLLLHAAAVLDASPVLAGLASSASGASSGASAASPQSSADALASAEDVAALREAGYDALVDALGLGGAESAARGVKSALGSSCGLDVSSSTVYSLSKLKRTGDQSDWTTTTQSGNLVWWLNVCASTTSMHGCTSEGAGLVVINTSKRNASDEVEDEAPLDVETSQCHVLGTAPVTFSLLSSSNPKSGVRGTYSPGETCPSSGQPYELLVDFMCESSNKITAGVDPSNPCSALIRFESPHACPGKRKSGGGGLSGGWVFFIIVLVTSVVYVAAGCVYNRKHKGAETWRESCPQSPFWLDTLPGLVKDGCTYSYQVTTRLLCDRGSESDYTSVE